MLNQEQAKLIVKFAENDLSISKTARSMYLSGNAIRYRLKGIQNSTGLDPRKFYDFKRLEAGAAALLGICDTSAEDDFEFVYRAAFCRWGKALQTIVAIEEMSELTKELCKELRGFKNAAEIAEEIADVQITMEELIVMHDCADDVKRQKKAKIERLKKRLKEAADGDA